MNLLSTVGFKFDYQLDTSSKSVSVLLFGLLTVVHLTVAMSSREIYVVDYP